jgi:hypothetical protein
LVTTLPLASKITPDPSPASVAICTTCGCVALTTEMYWDCTTRINWTAYWFGCFAGIVPWIAVAIYLIGAADPPAFVYAIYASIFVFFNIFALNMLLQYRLEPHLDLLRRTLDDDWTKVTCPISAVKALSKVCIMI